MNLWVTQLAKVAIIGLCLVKAAPLRADDSKYFPDRQEMQDHYRQQLAGRATVFKSAPAHQVVPAKKTVTGILSVDVLDVTVADDSAAPEVSNHALKLKGYAVTPLVAFTNKSFGLGFGAEYGKKQAHYYNKGQGYFQETESHLTESGVGAYAYYIPEIKLWSDKMVLTIIGGVFSYNAEQEFAAPKYQDGESQYSNYRYQVQRSNFGVNISFRFVNNFAIIPWYDVNFVRLGDVNGSDGEKIQNGSLSDRPEGEAFEMDRDLFWTIAPKHRFGIDLAVTLGRFEVNFGGALGAIGGLAGGSDRIADKGASVNLSFSVKSR